MGLQLFFSESEHPEACWQPSGLDQWRFSDSHKFSDRNVGSTIELERNEYYCDAKGTKIKSVIYHVADSDSEVLRFRANELDITSNVPAAYVQEAKVEFAEEPKVSSFLGVYYIGFDLTNPRFGSDPNFRAALFHGIDREAIAWKVLGRDEHPTITWVLPEV